jgi:hypothetical protein
MTDDIPEFDFSRGIPVGGSEPGCHPYTSSADAAWSIA